MSSCLKLANSFLRIAHLASLQLTTSVELQGSKQVFNYFIFHAYIWLLLRIPSSGVHLSFSMQEIHLIVYMCDIQGSDNIQLCIWHYTMAIETKPLTNETELLHYMSSPLHNCFARPIAYCSLSQSPTAVEQYPFTFIFNATIHVMCLFWFFSPHPCSYQWIIPSPYPVIECLSTNRQNLHPVLVAVPIAAAQYLLLHGKNSIPFQWNHLKNCLKTIYCPSVPRRATNPDSANTTMVCFQPLILPNPNIGFDDDDLAQVMPFSH